MLSQGKRLETSGAGGTGAGAAGRSRRHGQEQEQQAGAGGKQKAVIPLLQGPKRDSAPFIRALMNSCSCLLPLLLSSLLLQFLHVVAAIRSGIADLSERRSTGSGLAYWNLFHRLWRPAGWSWFKVAKPGTQRSKRCRPRQAKVKSRTPG
jgi:hypothetical protein